MQKNNYITESLTSNTAVLKVDLMVLFNEYFYVYGGLGVYYSDVRTKIETNYSSYVYEGLEGKIANSGIQAGLGIYLPLTSKIKLNLNLEGIYFPSEETGSPEYFSYKFGIVPTSGISIFW